MSTSYISQQSKKRRFMKPFLPVLFAFAIVLASESATAQTGSDYYMPLKVGNYLTFHSDGHPSGWAPRTTTYTFEGTDSISGDVYFRERGREVADDSSFNDAFLLRWLGKDAAGNVLIAAVGETSSDLDSAFILPAPSPFFPNQALVPGYSITYPNGNYFMQDSTISDTVTVEGPLGTFSGCVKKSETHYDSSGNVIFLEYHYFAAGVGMVLNERVKPENDAHTDVLIGYSIETSVHERASTASPVSFSLSQNYPNPFNPTTVISYKVTASSHVTLKVYDILGRDVVTLVNGLQSAGEHSVTFNAASMPSGVYFYRLQAGTSTVVRKMLLMK
jgi:Secretion system C-terminal sorting domain